MMYIGPGAGFAFLGSFLALAVSVAASIVSFLIWPFRMLWLLLRRNRGLGKARVRKIIFLGLDGLDPKLTERFLAEGKLPNLARLQQQGGYRRLRTTYPALSPVAWSTFATGVNPAKHNIFDFLNRDLRSYAPELSSAKVRPGSIEFRRKSEPFWKILGRNAIRSTILRVPVTFPPEPFAGRMLSAMSTPDLRGTQGTFSSFPNAGENWEGSLEGPEKRTIPFYVRTGPAGVALHIQGQTLPLRHGEYTPWVRLRFGKVRGIARLLLTEDSLYVTPVEIDPEAPAMPISHPSYYASYLARLLGSFATLGMAEDTWALNEGAISDDAFLEQAKSIQSEREAMFFGALQRTRHGVVACVFDTTDRVQHMFWTPREERHAHVIEDLYRDMDRLVGQALEYVDESTAFFVLSDHGFCGFERGINLNAWLAQQGYLSVREGEIDWSRTRAYTVGLGGLYLNLRGREAQGIVSAEHAADLKSRLIAGLTNLKDGERVAIQHVYDSSEIYHGPYLDAAPDLIIGYADGYRASWGAALGKVSEQVFEDNEKPWCGDHCVDPTLVPGVLFSNLSMRGDDPGIEDMAPTALRLFGVDIPAWMEGKPLVDPA